MATTINNYSSAVATYNNADDTADQAQAEQAAGTAAAGQAMAASHLNVVAPAATSTAAGATAALSQPVDSSVRAAGASTAASTVSAAYALNSSTPELPMAKVEGSVATTARAAASTVSNFNLSDSEAYRIIQEMSQKNFSLDATLTNLGNKAVISAKMKQVNDLHSQIQGERKSAITTLAYSTLAAGVSGGMAYGGTKMRQAEETAGENALTAHNSEAKNLSSNKSLADDDLKALTEKNDNSFVSKYRAEKLGIISEKNETPTTTANAGSDVKAEPTYTDRKVTSLEPSKDESLNNFHKWRTANAEGRGTEASTRWEDVKTDFREYSAQGLGKKDIKTVGVRAAQGAAIDATGQAAGQVVNSLGTLTDKLAGGQHEADQAKMAQKEDDVQISIAQQVLDSAKAMKEKDLKDVSDALDKIKDAASRYAAVIDKIG